MKWLNFSGVGLILVGSVLLYFFAVPWKQVRGGILFGPIYMQTDEAPEVQGWPPEATISIKTCRRYSRLGFALIAVGSALQLIAIASNVG